MHDTWSRDGGEYRIRRYGAADWRPLRDVRLEMLADTPLAYVETLDEAQRRPDDEWRERAAWADDPHRIGLAVELSESGRWVGLARCSVFDEFDHRPFVYSVYVARPLRGTGLADELLDLAEGWARAQGHGELYLYVHQDNARAIAFYRRRGFVETGNRVPFPQDPRQAEHEMRLTLGTDESDHAPTLCG